MTVDVRTAVSSDPLDVRAHEDFVGRDAAGAVVVFRGVVRDHDEGRSVTRIEYQGHPTADAALADIVASFAGVDDVTAIAVSHRLGTLDVGEVALVAAVSAPHREQAFATCARLVDEVKHRLPIWKRQVFADGTDEWVNCP